jgi:hypothetical protein
MVGKGFMTLHIMATIESTLLQINPDVVNYPHVMHNQDVHHLDRLCIPQTFGLRDGEAVWSQVFVSTTFTEAGSHHAVLCVSCLLRAFNELPWMY